jgi:hypothetical protein
MKNHVGKECLLIVKKKFLRKIDFNELSALALVADAKIRQEHNSYSKIEAL